jgi:hypothetical protein
VQEQAMTLKDGSTPNDPRLGRIYQEDWRSLNFMAADRMTSLQMSKPRSFSWQIPGAIVLDQGQEGACVGFGWTHELLAKPMAIPQLDGTFAREKIYWPAQVQDEWPGGAYPAAEPRYEGTSVLAGAKVCQSLGYFREYRWAMNTLELALAIGYQGPAVIGVKWMTGMFNTDPEGFIHTTGTAEGGHCVMLNQTKIFWTSDRQVNPDKSYLGGINSWGTDWGVGGKFRITFTEFDKLVEGSDLCIPVNRAKGN